MSHLVAIQTEVRDAEAVHLACLRRNLAEPVARTVAHFSGRATVLAIELPGSRYPVVFDLPNARIHFDNCEGHWGELDRFLQAYAVEKCRLEARRQGHQVTEQALADGSIRLTVKLAGGAA